MKRGSVTQASEAIRNLRALVEGEMREQVEVIRAEVDVVFNGPDDKNSMADEVERLSKKIESAIATAVQGVMDHENLNYAVTAGINKISLRP